MADAYRGLTIKFGGDTTTLQKALKAASSAATSTQKQLKLVEQAAKFNPGSINTVTTQVNLLKNKSQDLATQLKVVKEAIAQTSTKTVMFGGATQSVAELAANTENAALSARLATERYNALDSQLASTYREINRNAKSLGSLKDAADETRQAWTELVDRLGGKFDMREVMQLDESDFKQAVALIEELGVATDEQVAKLVDMRDAWVGAFNDNEAAKAVEALEQLDVQSESLTAQIGQLSTKMAELRAPSDLAASFTDTNVRIEQIDRSIEELERDIERCDQALKIDPSNLEAASQRMADLKQATELANEKAELLQQEIAGYSAAGLERVVDSTEDIQTSTEQAHQAWVEVRSELSNAEGNLEQLKSDAQKFANLGDDGAKAYKETTAQIKQAESEVEELRQAEQRAGEALDQMTDAGELKNLKEQLSECKLQAQEFTAAMQTSSALNWSDVKTLGMTLSATVTPALMQAAQSALDSASSIDSAYRDMRKTVNGTEEDFENLRQSAIEFSQTNVTSADQMLSIEALGGELGIATEALETFAETVSNMSVATDLDTEDAATALGQLSNILDDLDQNHMSNFSDALVRLGNNGASTESNIVSIAERIGSMGSIVGMTTPEILALASSVASTGQGAEAAGTAISNTISDIESAVANGGEALRQFADVSGMTADEFAQTWNDNPTQALKEFVEGLKAVEANGGSATATLEDLGITGTRQKQAIEGLMQTIDGLGSNLTMANDAWDGISDQWGEAGDAANEAEKKAEGLSGSLSKLSNMAENLGADIGDAALPYIRELTDIVGKATEAFEGLDDGTKTTIVAIGGIATAAGPALSVIATMGEKIGKLKEGSGIVGTLSKSFKSLKGNIVSSSTLRGVASGIEGITGSAKAAEVAVGALGTAATAGVAALVALAGSAVIGGIQSLVEEYQEAQEHAEALAEATRPIEEIMESAADGTGTFALALADVDVSGVLEDMAELNQTISDTFKELYQNDSMVDAYVGTMERLGNQGSISATDLTLLQQAVSGYNDITGDSIEITNSETGELSKSTEELEKNTAAWKRQARAKADSELASEAMKEQASITYDLQVANQKLTEAQSAYDEQLEKNTRAIMANGEYTEEQARAMAESMTAAGPMGEALDSARQNVDDLTASLQSATEKTDYFTQRSVIDSADVDETVRAAAEGILGSLESMGNGVSSAFQTAGVGFGDFSLACASAGVSTEQLNAVGSENIAALASTFGGNVDTMIWAIQNYNNVPLVEKDGVVVINDQQLVDAEGRVAQWNDNKLAYLDGSAVADTTELQDAQGRVYTWNDSKLEVKTAVTKEEGSAEAVDAAEKVTDALGGIPDVTTTNIKATDNASTTITSVRDKLNNLDGKTATTYVKTVYQSETQSAAGGVFAKHAAGGVFQGRTMYHADGLIVNTATDVTRHIAGEAGAEAIIPLTNRKYTTPFAQTISGLVVEQLEGKIQEITQRQRKALEKVADRMAGAASGTGQATSPTVNVYVNDATVNGYDEIVSATGDYLRALYAVGAV